MTDNKDQIINLFRDDNAETETMRNFILGSLISCENNETEEDRLGNIGALEKSGMLWWVCRRQPNPMSRSWNLLIF